MTEIPEINKFLTEKGVIVDICCGTGLSGKAMRDVGFKDIYGLDASQEMLNRCPPETYSKLIKCFLGVDALPQEINGTVDVVVCVSGMVYNHLPTSILETLLTVLKKGGHYVFNCRDSIYCDGSSLAYKETMDHLISEGKYAFVHRHKFVKGVEDKSKVDARSDLLAMQEASVYVFKKICE